MNSKSNQRVFAIKFSEVYPLYVQKARRKLHTRGEVDQVIRWLPGYSPAGLRRQIDKGNDFATFLHKRPPCIPSAC